MSAVEEITETENSRRLTFRQKFWLLSVGVPMLLVFLVLLLSVFLPKPLNRTERKLLGKWEVAAPNSMRGHVIEFNRDFLRGHIVELNHNHFYTITHHFQWRARRDWISVVGIGRSEFWSRLKLSLGLSSNEDHYRIIRLSENELEFEVRSGGVPVTLKRIGPASP
jgi:hypothetical protein